MIGFRDAVDDSNDTEASVRVGISDFNAEVRVEWRQARPDKVDELKMAQEVARKHHALAVFWRRDQRLVLYVPKMGESSLLDRPIGNSMKESSSDTVGLIVRRALDSLLSRTNAATTSLDNDSETDAPPSSEAELSSQPQPEPSSIFSTVPPIPPAANSDTPKSVEQEKAPQDANPDTELPREDSQPVIQTGDEKKAKRDTPRGDDAVNGANSREDTTRSGEVTPKAVSTPDGDGRLLAEILYGLDGMAVLYGLDGTGKDYVAFHSGRFGLGVRLISRLYLTVDYTVSSRLETRIDEVSGTLRLTRHPVGVGGRWGFFTRGRWQLGSGFLAEIDIIRKETFSTDERIQTSPDGTDVQVGLVPYVFAGLHLLGPLYAATHLGMRVVLDRTRYLAQPTSSEASRKAIYLPWQVQIRFSFGLYVLIF